MGWRHDKKWSVKTSAQVLEKRRLIGVKLYVHCVGWVCVCVCVSVVLHRPRFNFPSLFHHTIKQPDVMTPTSRDHTLIDNTCSQRTGVWWTWNTWHSETFSLFQIRCYAQLKVSETCALSVRFQAFTVKLSSSCF